MEIIKGLPLFDKLKQESPDAVKKIIAVKGDVCDINLGLSEDDHKMLVENVNIIYHTAASVRFDDILKDAVIINVRGTREVVKLALELKRIALFVHVSTTFCNTDKNVIEEKIYPAHADWRNTIKIAEECDDKVLKALSLMYMDPLPNTYTFAKSLAEHVVNDLCQNKIPAFILRPSVVISTIEEPIPGWNDNFNGPVGLLVAGGKGLLRTVLGNKNSTPDYMPVDYVVKGLIVATEHYALKRCINEVEVLHASQNKINNIKVGEVIEMGANLVQECPLRNILWNPRFSMTGCWYNYYIQVLLFHMLPAFFLDLALKFAGKKPILFTIQRKIYIANTVLHYFMDHTWTFLNDKLVILMTNLNDDEKKEFEVVTKGLSREEMFQYFKNGKLGAAHYILKEECGTEKAKKNLRRLWYIDMFVRSIFFTFVIWFFTVKMNVFHVFIRVIENYVQNLSIF